MKNSSYILAFLILFSCFKEEEPIAPFDRGEVITRTINTNTGNNGDYGKQIFFDFEANKIVRTNDRNAWDLAFDTKSDDRYVRINTASKMQVAKTGQTDFNGFTSLSGLSLVFDWDKASGSTDSLALKDWIIGGVPTNEVFVIDLGENPNLTIRGFRKMQILAVSPTDYTVKYANIDGSNEQTKSIPKDSDKNHTCFTFSGAGSVVDIEPNTDDWDVVFTQYFHTFYDSDPAISYSVNGVLLNHNKVKAVKVKDKTFENTSFSDLSLYTLTNNWNVIGYDWKTFDFGTTVYEMDPTNNYLIQSRNGIYYKLRFIDFYSDMGIKGYPKFEFIGL